MKDPRIELYQQLVKTLGGIEGVRHVALWNQDVYYVEESEPWQRPAVFIEFGEIAWSALKDAFRGTGELRLHTVVDWSSQAPIEAWTLTDKIWRALESLEAEMVSGYYPDKTVTNNSHETLYENVDVFRVSYIKPWCEEET